MLAETAVREIREETGIQVNLGVPIGVSRYRLPNAREKIVHYWATEATDAAVRASSFVPNREIAAMRSEKNTSELQSLMRISYAVFCLQKKKQTENTNDESITPHTK